MNGAPLVSVIVVTWNGKKYALECLESLRAQSVENLEIIVVDNGSTDGTPEAIRDEYPEVVLLENGCNLGFATANNIGMQACHGEYIALINSDVVVPRNCLQRIVEFMRGKSNVGMVGPKMLSPNGTIGDSVMRLPTIANTLCCALGLHKIFKYPSRLSGFLMAGFPYNQRMQVEVLTGWFWVVRRKALQQVGGLDERFFMYGEDIDWCHRFRNAGWQVLFFPEAEALHYGAASSATAPARFYVEMRRANLQYFRKYHGWWATSGYALTTAIYEIVRVIGFGWVYCVTRYRRSEAAAKVLRSVASIRSMLGRGFVIHAK